MCGNCETWGQGYCFCGTKLDPQQRQGPCECKSGNSSCQWCGHQAGPGPSLPTDVPSDYFEYE